MIAHIAIKVKSKESLNYANVGRNLFFSDITAVKEYQKDQLRKLYLYAYNHTRYYKSIFDEIDLIKKGEIVWENENKIPILTKEILRDRMNDIVCDEVDSRYAYDNTSGGSTGVPVLFKQDRLYFERNFGNLILMGWLNDKYEGDKEIKLWGSERDIIQGSISLRDKIINLIYNRKLLNSFLLTDELMKTYCSEINNFMPKQIWTYVDSMYCLAKYIIANNISMFSPQNIITTAGCLYDDIRETIAKAFPDSRIINQYGSREVGLIGCEFKNETGIYVFEHSQKVEVLDKKTGYVSQTGEGEILITNLNNYCMPLIRYDIGDEGILEINDSKERTSVYKKITKLYGRRNSHIIRSDGSKIHGEYFTHLFYLKSWVKTFKVVQHDIENIEFMIVLNSGYNKDDPKVVNDIKDMIDNTKILMGDTKVTITFCNKIAKLASGKHQFVTTEVKLGE